MFEPWMLWYAPAAIFGCMILYYAAGIAYFEICERLERWQQKRKRVDFRCEDCGEPIDGDSWSPCPGGLHHAMCCDSYIRRPLFGTNEPLGIYQSGTCEAGGLPVYTNQRVVGLHMGSPNQRALHVYCPIEH